MSLSALVTCPGVEEALLCPVLCGESFLPEKEEEGEEAVLASAPLSTGDTDEKEEPPLTCMPPFGDAEEAKEAEEEEAAAAEEEALVLSVLPAPEEEELEEAGTFAALVFLGFFWLASLSRNFLSASSGGGPLKA